MTLRRLQPEFVCNKFRCFSLRWISVSATGLLLLVLQIAVCAAQQSDIDQWIEGVNRSSATPASWRSPRSLPGRVVPTTPVEARGMREFGVIQTSAEQEVSSSHIRLIQVENEDDWEEMPLPRIEGRVPLTDVNDAGVVQINDPSNGLLSLVVRDASLSRVLSLLAQTQNLNIVASNDIDAIISITLQEVPIDEALTAILAVANYTWTRRGNIIMITSLSDSEGLPADVQGREIQVFDLDFVSAIEVANAVEGFLSPVGTVTVNESESDDNRRTREMVIVEDLPESLGRIASYVHQVDQPPRQVQIEAHVFQVDLKDTTRAGVDFDALLRVGSDAITLETKGFANPAAPTAFLATVDGVDFGQVVELLQTTSDVKTLGSPKLLVINEQEARIQVGEQLGFRVTTTTETSTLESVQFLDVGVILEIRPRITRDCRVLLHVKPAVSTGQINPDTGLPEEETTELETDVMLDDGQGMIIGGLIKETDSVTQSKIPWLGDVKGVGFLFRKTEVVKDRVEIIIALVPRVQPYQKQWHDYEEGQLVKTGVPLYEGRLNRTHRPWDVVLPDGKRVARPMLHPLQEPRMMEPNCGPNCHYYLPDHPLPEQTFGTYYGDPSCAEPVEVQEDWGQPQMMLPDGYGPAPEPDLWIEE